ncbi:hypothetical protein [Streptomyces bacillaris]|uniref:hypothetical protein n=1 Tax=Streptomyces bacillaris TaxID=68179 RepID=UPI00345FF10A
MRTRTTITTAIATALLTLTACGTTPDEVTPAAGPAPAYKIVKQDTEGNARTVVVEVDSTDGLEAVFDDVAKKLTEEGGYFVQINCSSGSTEHVDNRLANGKKAVGKMGAVRTGMDDGATEFEPNEGRSCPDA